MPQFTHVAAVDVLLLADARGLSSLPKQKGRNSKAILSVSMRFCNMLRSDCKVAEGPWVSQFSTVMIF
jgi:hypothetical protein